MSVMLQCFNQFRLFAINCFREHCFVKSLNFVDVKAVNFSSRSF